MSIEIERNMTPSAKTPHIVIGAQSNDHSAYLAGVSPKRFFTDALTFAHVQLLVTEYYGVDAPINFWCDYTGFLWLVTGGQTPNTLGVFTSGLNWPQGKRMSRPPEVKSCMLNCR